MKTELTGKSIGVLIKFNKDNTITVRLSNTLKEYKGDFKKVDMGSYTVIDIGVLPWCPRIQDKDLEYAIDETQYNCEEAKSLWFEEGDLK